MVTDYTDLAMAPVRMFTHPSTNQAHGSLTLVINYKMLTPSYCGSFSNNNYYNNNVITLAYCNYISLM